VPFIVWVHRYSDRLGFGDVPMTDDLYDDRIATADFGLLTASLFLLTGTEWWGVAPVLTRTAGALALAGALLFTINVVGVIREHSPRSLAGVLFGTVAPGEADPADDDDPADASPWSRVPDGYWYVPGRSSLVGWSSADGIEHGDIAVARPPAESDDEAQPPTSATTANTVARTGSRARGAPGRPRQARATARCARLTRRGRGRAGAARASSSPRRRPASRRG